LKLGGKILHAKSLLLLILILPGLLIAQSPEDPLCIGCEAPTFSLPSLEGDYTSLRDFCGEKLRKPWKNKLKHVVVLSFFATWCEPCKKEIPHLEKLQDEFKDKPVKFFLIDVGEERDKIAKFIQDTNVQIPVLLDRYQKAAEKYDALTLPRLYVLDQYGKIQRKQKGFSNPDDFEIEMRELINMLLENGP
jgi:thiol-disulfide isomerase/thioredoxin